MRKPASMPCSSNVSADQLAGPSYEKLEEELGQLRAKAPPPVRGSLSPTNSAPMAPASLGRPAGRQDVESAMRFIGPFQNGLEQMETDAGKRRMAAWQSFCQALFVTTEFRFVD
ncbi:MAG: hypothetical protein ABI651_16205 [Verrucomicrobiota bacterium]